MSNSIAVEGGNFYLGEENDAGFEVSIAKVIGFKLREAGFFPRYYALLDETDLARQMKIDPSANYRTVGYVEARVLGAMHRRLERGHGFDATLLLESQYKFEALRVIDEIYTKVSDPYFLSKKRNKIIYKDESDKKSSIRLLGKSGDNTYPSCEVLDLCMYRDKLSYNQGAVTVLPEKLITQQERVKILSEILGLHLNVAVVFFNDEGRVCRDKQYWCPEAFQTFASILESL